MEPLIFSTTLAFDQLTDSTTAVTGILDGAKLRLFTNDVTPGPNSVTGDFTTATYTGYADEVITWNAVSVSDDGLPEVVGIAGEFRPTDAVTPNVVYGVILITSAGTFIAGSRFTGGPLPMGSALDAIVCTPRVRAANSGLTAVVS